MFNSDIQEHLEKIDNQIRELNELKEDLLSDTNKDEIESFSSFKNRVSKKPKPIKYETGVFAIDSQVGGFAEGSFIQLAGESFAGKSTLSLKILSNISRYAKTLFFSFEMYESVLVNYLKELDEVQANNLMISQDHRELSQIERVIAKYSKELNIRFIAIDSRMKINVSGKMEEFQKNSTISKELSRMCQKYGVIILLINQISEGDLKSGRLSLKGSGDQVYDSDVLLYITVEGKNTENEKRWLICDKDRIGQKRWKALLEYSKPKEIVYNMPVIWCIV